MVSAATAQPSAHGPPLPRSPNSTTPSPPPTTPLAGARRSVTDIDNTLVHRNPPHNRSATSRKPDLSPVGCLPWKPISVAEWNQRHRGLSVRAPGVVIRDANPGGQSMHRNDPTPQCHCRTQAQLGGCHRRRERRHSITGNPNPYHIEPRGWGREHGG